MNPSVFFNSVLSTGTGTVDWISPLLALVGTVIGGSITLVTAKWMYELKLTNDRISEIRHACSDLERAMSRFVRVAGHCTVAKPITDDRYKMYLHFQPMLDELMSVKLQASQCRLVCDSEAMFDILKEWSVDLRKYYELAEECIECCGNGFDMQRFTAAREETSHLYNKLSAQVAKLLHDMERETREGHFIKWPGQSS